MAKFEKGNTLWKTNEGFKRNSGRLTKEMVNSEEWKAKKKAGNERYKAYD